MAALYDSIGPFPPAWPDDWHLWMKLPERMLMVYMPSGVWAPWRNVSAPGAGHASLAAPLFGGSIAGAHELLPQHAAMAEESLSLDGSAVATLEDLQAAKDRILKAFMPKAVVAGVLPPRDIKKMVAGAWGLLVMVSDNEPVEMPPEMLPSVGGAIFEWSKCHVDLAPMMTNYNAGLRRGRCRILSLGEQQMVAARNYGDSNGGVTGVWVDRLANAASGAPQFRAANQGRDGHALTLVCSYTILGVQ